MFLSPNNARFTAAGKLQFPIKWTKRGKVFISNLLSWVGFIVELWCRGALKLIYSQWYRMIYYAFRCVIDIYRLSLPPLWLLTHLLSSFFSPCSCTLCAAWCRAVPITRRRRWAIIIDRLSRCCIDPYAQISISRRRKRTAKPPAPPCTARSTTKVSNR